MYINSSVRRGRSKCGVHAKSGLAHSSRHVMCEARTECRIMAGRRHTAVLLRAKKKGHTKPQTTLDAVSRDISASSVLTAASIAAHIRQITACSDSRHGSRRARHRPGTKAAAACRDGSDGQLRRGGGQMTRRNARQQTYLEQPRRHDAAREAVGECGLRVVQRQHRVPNEEAGRMHEHNVLPQHTDRLERHWRVLVGLLGANVQRAERGAGRRVAQTLALRVRFLLCFLCHTRRVRVLCIRGGV